MGTRIPTTSWLGNQRTVKSRTIIIPENAKARVSHFRTSFAYFRTFSYAALICSRMLVLRGPVSRNRAPIMRRFFLRYSSTRLPSLEAHLRVCSSWRGLHMFMHVFACIALVFRWGLYVWLTRISHGQPRYTLRLARVSFFSGSRYKKKIRW